MDCSTMIRSVVIWSVHDLLLRKPAWWSLSLASTPVFSLSKMTLLRTFPGTDKSIIPLQFLHPCISPFFVSFTRYPSSLSVGISSCSHIFPNRSCSFCVEVSMSALIASAGFCLGRKLFLSSSDGWFSQSLLTWSFAVYLEYFFSWCDVWRVLRWWPV